MSFINLKLITLENLCQVTVESSSSNESRSYGRRFTVNMGIDSQEVILKDLFRRAQKFTKKATSASELNEVNKFIGKLKAAETVAAKTYSDRDDRVYKFRSWFHRFFGGAFLGTHLGRLGKLKTKVDSKQEKLIEAFKSYFQENQPIFQSFVNKVFEVKVDDHTFDARGEISEPDGLIIKIQKKEDLGTDLGLLAIKKNALNECVIEYEGQTDGVTPELSIVLSEISKEVEAREIKAQEFQRTLTLVRAVVNKLDQEVAAQLTFEGEEYEISRSGYGITPEKIYIQETKHKGTETSLLSISLAPQFADDIEFEFEGNKVPSIPETMIPLYDAIVLEAYKRSSSYSEYNINMGSASYSGYKIKIVREGIKHIPEWHLNELCNLWKNGDNLGVSFLIDTLEQEEGGDAGGLKRDYIATLAASLQESKVLFTSIEGSLKLPRILRENEDPIVYCNEEEVKTYGNLGLLFSRCYKSESMQQHHIYERDLITTGLFFSEALFKAALSLKDSEFVDNGVPTENVYVKIGKVLLTHLDTEKTPTIKAIIHCLDLTEETLEPFLQPNDPTLYQAVLLAGENEYTDDNGDPDIEKIQNDPTKFLDDLHAGIFKDTSLINELKGVPLGAMLDPVYQIAKGLKSGTRNWNRFSNKSPVEVSNKIQGSIDRGKIVASIICPSFNFTVSKKAGWLKEWVENEATDEELKSFLKFVTGGASLPEGKNLEIKAQAVGQPFPTVCTCALGISVSDQMSYSGWKKDMWDSKKDDFIRNLKQAMVVEGFQNR